MSQQTMMRQQAVMSQEQKLYLQQLVAQAIWDKAVADAVQATMEREGPTNLKPPSFKIDGSVRNPQAEAKTRIQQSRFMRQMDRQQSQPQPQPQPQPLLT